MRSPAQHALHQVSISLFVIHRDIVHSPADIMSIQLLAICQSLEVRFDYERNDSGWAVRQVLFQHSRFHGESCSFKKCCITVDQSHQIIICSRCWQSSKRGVACCQKNAVRTWKGSSQMALDHIRQAVIVALVGCP